MQTSEALAEIDSILHQAQAELHALDNIAASRTLTPDEVDEVRYLRKLIDAEMRFRAVALTEGT